MKPEILFLICGEVKNDYCCCFKYFLCLFKIGTDFIVNLKEPEFLITQSVEMLQYLYYYYYFFLLVSFISLLNKIYSNTIAASLGMLMVVVTFNNLLEKDICFLELSFIRIDCNYPILIPELSEVILAMTKDL